MKVSSRFYSSLGLLIILNVVIKPIWIFGIDRQVQNVVGTTIYGSYYSLFSFSIVLSFLLDWGLTNFYNRQLAADQQSFTNKAGSFLFIKLLLILLYAAVVAGVAYVTGVRNWTILTYVIIIQALTSLFIFLRTIITAYQWFSTDAWLSITDKGLMILLCGSFLWFPAVAGEITMEKFLQAQVTCTALAVIVVLIVLLKRGITFSWRTNSMLNRKLLRSILPFGIIFLLMSVHNRLDSFLLERMHGNGAYETGLYAGAYRLLDAASMAGYLLATFLLPFVARHQENRKMMNDVIVNSRHLLMIFSLTTTITIVFLGPWIQQLLYHNTDSAAIIVLQWCLPALVAYSLVQIYGTVMTANGQLIQFCYIVLGSVFLNIVMNLLLIPGWGAQGSCIAALASQAFCGITAMLYVHKKSGINMHLRSLLMYIFIAGIVGVFYYGSRDLAISKWMLIIVAGLLTLTVMIVLRLIDIKKWRNISKQI